MQGLLHLLLGGIESGGHGDGECGFVRGQSHGAAGGALMPSNVCAVAAQERAASRRRDFMRCLYCAALNVTLALKVYCVPDPLALELKLPWNDEVPIQFELEYPLA